MDSVSRQLLMSGTSGAVAPPTAPLSIWTMDDISGNAVPDSVGTLTGTKYGGSVVTGRVGSALNQASTSNYISMGRAQRSAYDTASNSVAIWAKFNTLNNGYLFANHARAGDSGSTYNNGWFIGINSSGGVSAGNVVLDNETWTDGGIGGSSTNPYPRVSAANGTLTTADYFHIAAVSLDKSITLYVNGVKIGTTTHSQSKRTGNGDSSINGIYSLGNWLYDNTTFLTGVLADIDEARHYNYALTDSNVEWLYANT